MRVSFRLSDSRKAQANNYFAVIVSLFSFAVLTLIGYVLMTNFIQGFVDAGIYTGAVAAAGNSYLRTLLVFDKLTALIMTVLIVGVGVTSYRLATSNVYFIITFLLSAFYGLVAYFFNYMFAQIASNAAFATAIAYFPITILICTNLHWVMLICIIVGSITLYAKKERGQLLS